MDSTFTQLRNRAAVPPAMAEAMQRVRAAGWTPSEHSIVRSDGSIYAMSRETMGRLGYPAFVCEFRYGKFWESGDRR